MHRISDPRTIAWYTGHVVLVVVGLAFSWLGPESWVRAIGASVAAAGFAGGILYVYVGKMERLESGIKMLEDFGIKQVFEGRSVRMKDQYDSRCRDMKQHLDILGFGLSSFVEDHAGDIETWKRKADIRILVLDPDFPNTEVPYSEQRDVEEQNDVGDIRRDVEKLKRALAPHIGTQNGKTFGVRLYRCLPSVNIFRVDDELFWGPYFMAQQSRNTPTILVTHGKLFDRIIEHFNDIWNSETLSVALVAGADNE